MLICDCRLYQSRSAGKEILCRDHRNPALLPILNSNTFLLSGSSLNQISLKYISVFIYVVTQFHLSGAHADRSSDKNASRVLNTVPNTKYNYDNKTTASHVADRSVHRFGQSGDSFAFVGHPDAHPLSSSLLHFHSELS